MLVLHTFSCQKTVPWNRFAVECSKPGNSTTIPSMKSRYLLSDCFSSPIAMILRALLFISLKSHILKNEIIFADFFFKSRAVILFIVEDVTYNICDQRFHEFEIRKQNPNVKVIRRNLTELGRKGASLDAERRLIM